MTIYRNRSIDRALGLLEALRDARAGLGLTELAGRTGLELSTAFRLVSVLVERRYVHYDVQSRRYSLGYGSFRLAQPDHVLRAVRRMSQRFLSRLAVELGATVLLGELHGPRLCIYAEGKGGQASPYGVRVRGFLDAHATAMGKMLLAHRPAREVEGLYAGGALVRHTHATVGAMGELRRELRKIEQQGFAVEEGECLPGVCALAVPIVPPAGGVRFAISAAGGPEILKEDQRSAWRGGLRRTSGEIVDYGMTPARSA